MDKSFDFSVGQMQWWLLFFPSFFCELICHFISPNAGVCWYLLKNYIGSLSEGVDVLCELLVLISNINNSNDNNNNTDILHPAAEELPWCGSQPDVYGQSIHSP